jgi:hypothetical protein
MSNKSNAAVAAMGIDIGKNSFHVVGLDQRGAIALRQKWSRGQVEGRLVGAPWRLAAPPNRRVRSIQSWTSSSERVLMKRMWSRPSMRCSTTPLTSGTRMCFDTGFNDIWKGPATSVTRASPRESRSDNRPPRRIG